MKHDEKPIKGNLSEEQLNEMLETMFNSPYSKYVNELKELIVGKLVSSTLAGKSGYVLLFSDGSFIVSYLSNSLKRLDYKVGQGQPGASEIELINLIQAGNGALPLTVNLPYADEGCDMSAEVAKSVNHEVTGIAIGENSFNICFEDNIELEAVLVPDPEGKTALRVFWEQW